MAERRMFAKTIVTSDAFLDMPATARLLYYDLGMRADDDGFINSPRRVMRETGASDDDMNILLAKGFVLRFDSGVYVVKHWRINNQLKSDRHKPTEYQEEFAMLTLKPNKAYSLKSPERLAFDAGLSKTPVCAACGSRMHYQAGRWTCVTCGQHEHVMVEAR